MAALPGFRGQTNLIDSYRFDGTIISATAPQIIVPRAAPRSVISIQNTSSGTLWLEIGPARAKATVTNGVVTSVTVTNGGFGYSIAPRVVFLGGAGAAGNNGLNLGVGYPGAGTAPTNIAQAVCVMTGSAPNMSIASITVTYGGSGYSNDTRAAPYVQLVNDPNDQFGCANPYNGGLGSGFQLLGGSVFYEAYSAVSTDALSIWGASTTQTFSCRIVQ